MNASSRITEALMREALRGSGTTVWAWDVRDDRLSSTDDSAALLGYAPGEITDDQQAWNALIHPDDRAENHAAYLRHAAGLTPLYEHEYRALGKDGAWHWLLERGRVVERDAAGEPLRVVGVLSDITDRRALQEARTETLAAQAANQAKTEFLSRMSHELRTPLNAVLGFAQLLEIDEQDRLTEQQRRRVGLIREAGTHLLEMIGELLDLTRIESGQLAVSVVALPLGGLLVDSAELVRPQAEAAGVQLQVAPVEATLAVQADPTRLRQVLLNLLGNAVKYNRRGGRIALSAVRQGDEAVIAVADTGVGIAAADLPMLFQPFQRGAQARGGIEGVGIGLAVTRSLVELMGGRVEVDSTPDVGSTFRVVLRPAP